MQTEQFSSENDGSGDALAERYISFKNHNLLPFLSYCASFAHLITLKTILNSLCVHWNTCKLYNV